VGSERTPGFSGAPLGGVTLRTSYWGGQENDLLRSINDCLYYFMFASTPWTGQEEEAIQIYAFLETLEDEGDGSPQGFTIGPVADPPEGDAARGETVYANACASCHGTKSTADQRLLPTAPTLPDETLANHPAPEYTDKDRRLVFVEKIRHGGFFGYGGQMPPLSLEVLSDEDLADLLTYLGVPAP
jgi:thiosulfate dehydrogenase